MFMELLLKTICFSINKFKHRTSNEREAQLVEPIKVITKKMVEKIHNIILKDQPVKVCETADIVNISSKQVLNTLHKEL